MTRLWGGILVLLLAAACAPTYTVTRPTAVSVAEYTNGRVVFLELQEESTFRGSNLVAVQTVRYMVQCTPSRCFRWQLPPERPEAP